VPTGNFAQHRVLRTAASVGGAPVSARHDFLPGRPMASGDVRAVLHLCERRVYGHAAAENLERLAEREETGSAATAAQRSASRGAAEPDQSPFSFQYAELSLIAHSNQARRGAQHGVQVVEHPAPAAAKNR